MKGKFGVVIIIPVLASSGPGDPIPIASTSSIVTFPSHITVSTQPIILSKTACSPSWALVGVVCWALTFPSRSARAQLIFVPPRSIPT